MTATPSRLLLLVVSAVLVAPAVVAGFDAATGSQTPLATAHAHVRGGDAPAAPPREGPGDAPPASRPNDTRPPPPREASFELHVSETEVWIPAGGHAAVAFGAKNSGGRPLALDLTAAAKALKAFAEPGHARLAPGEGVRGTVHVGAGPNATGDHVVVLVARGHPADCARTQAASAGGCHEVRREVRILVHVAGEPAAVRMALDPAHQRVAAGGTATYLLRLANSGGTEASVDLVSRLRAPEGWTHELSDASVLVPARGEARVELRLRAPEGAWTGERAIVEVAGATGEGERMHARASAEVFRHD